VQSTTLNVNLMGHRSDPFPRTHDDCASIATAAT
jgi:hypothetical protein